MTTADPIRPGGYRYVSLVVDRHGDTGEVLAGPFRRHEDADAARTLLRDGGHTGELWVATVQEAALPQYVHNEGNAVTFSFGSTMRDQ